ncbi:hypothetical protein [Micromonospora sp. NPDC005367]|uniref:hypothetical protein n=1 Tax=Micromonospora sp. NPDC005367 TaxID=3155590 RepID=UPI0033AC4977
MRRMIPVVSIALAVLVAGCGTGSGSPTGSPGRATSAADPVTTIKEGMGRSLSGTVTMDASVKIGQAAMELTGKMDPAARVLTVVTTAPEEMEARLIGDAAYIKSESFGSDKPWMKIDLTKLRPESPLRQSFDLRSQTGLVGGIVTAEKVGEGSYKGTADLEKAVQAASDDGGMREGLESTAKLAKDPKAIPFETTVDVEGRVTALSYTIATKSLGDLVTELRMSDFGEKVTATAPPAGETADASADMYKFL